MEFMHRKLISMLQPLGGIWKHSHGQCYFVHGSSGVFTALEKTFDVIIHFVDSLMYETVTFCVFQLYHGPTTLRL